MYVSGNYAYVASSGDNALEIIDISNPAGPVHKGSIAHGTGGASLLKPYSVCVSGNYAYLACSESNALEVIDISDPTTPIHKGSIRDGTGQANLLGPRSVYVSGNYAYLASFFSNALEIVDVSEPATPVHKGSLINGAGGAKLLTPNSVYVSGNYAYVASGNSTALEIIDISDPTSPFHVGNINDGSGGALLNYPISVYTSGDFAYVVSSNNNALEIVSLSMSTQSITGFLPIRSQIYGNPPLTLSGIATSSGLTVSLTSSNLYVATISGKVITLLSTGISTITAMQGGDDFYLAANPVSQTLTINTVCNEPLSPSHAGSLIDGVDGALLKGAGSVYVSENYAYVASNKSSALEIVDISNPAFPVHKGSLTHGTSGALLYFPQSVYVLGSYAYVASTFSSALEIIDISNPDTPIHKGSLIDGTGGALLAGPTSVYVSGNYAYVVSQGNTFEIVDVSNPAAPVHKGSLRDGAGGTKLNYPKSVFVSGKHAFIASFFSNALEIVDISNPAAPVHKASLSDSTGGAKLNYPTSVYVVGNYAYVTSDYALEIIDISNPSSPKHSGSITYSAGGALLSGAQSVYVVGNYAYVASQGSKALEIVDVTNPAAPVHLRSLTNGTDGALLSDPFSVFVDGNYAYVASYSSNALEVISLFSPASQAITEFSMPSSVSISLGTISLTGSATSKLPLKYESSSPAIAGVSANTISGNSLNLLSPGVTTITVSQGGNNCYTAATPVSQELTVFGNQSQTITGFNPLAPQTFGNLPITLTGISSSSGLKVNFTSSNISVAKVNGNVITFLSAGVITITALQNGNITFNPAIPIAQVLTINKVNQTLSFAPLPDVTLAGKSFIVTLSGFASSNLKPVYSFNSTPLGIASLSGNLLKLKDVGKIKVTASQPGNQNYNIALPIDVSFMVSTLSGFGTTDNTEITFDDNQFQVSIYPNPNYGTFTIVKNIPNPITVQLLNSQGMVIRTFLLDESTYEINGLRSGFYLLRAGTEIIKLIVK